MKFVIPVTRKRFKCRIGEQHFPFAIGHHNAVAYTIYDFLILALYLDFPFLCLNRGLHHILDESLQGCNDVIENDAQKKYVYRFEDLLYPRRGENCLVSRHFAERRISQKINRVEGKDGKNGCKNRM